jgi:hypothetical protein
MKILLFNAPWKEAFCRTQRWPVVNRTEALRYPDWLAYDTAGWDGYLVVKHSLIVFINILKLTHYS